MIERWKNAAGWVKVIAVLLALAVIIKLIGFWPTVILAVVLGLPGAFVIRQLRGSTGSDETDEDDETNAGDRKSDTAKPKQSEGKTSVGAEFAQKYGLMGDDRRRFADAFDNRDNNRSAFLDAARLLTMSQRQDLQTWLNRQSVYSAPVSREPQPAPVIDGANNGPVRRTLELREDGEWDDDSDDPTTGHDAPQADQPTTTVTVTDGQPLPVRTNGTSHWTTPPLGGGAPVDFFQPRSFINPPRSEQSTDGNPPTDS